MWSYCSARVWTQSGLKSEDARSGPMTSPAESSTKRQHGCALAHLTWSQRWSWPSPLDCKGLDRQKVEPNVTKSISPAADIVHLFLHRQRLWHVPWCDRKHVWVYQTLLPTFTAYPQSLGLSLQRISFLTCRFWRAKTQGSPTKQGRVMEEIV